MNDQILFHKAADDKLLVLKQLIPILYSGYKTEYFHSHKLYSPYDVCLTGYKDGVTAFKHLIKIKVRDKHYPQMLLEKRALEKIQKKADQHGAEVIYITVTPMGAFIYNLTKISKVEKFDWQEKTTYKATVVKSRGKAIRYITYLSIDLAKQIRDVKSTKLELYKVKEQKLKEQKNEVEFKCIFRDTKQSDTE